jgi:hypothetical protein
MVRSHYFSNLLAVNWVGGRSSVLGMVKIVFFSIDILFSVCSRTYTAVKLMLNRKCTHPHGTAWSRGPGT